MLIESELAWQEQSIESGLTRSLQIMHEKFDVSRIFSIELLKIFLVFEQNWVLGSVDESNNNLNIPFVDVVDFRDKIFPAWLRIRKCRCTCRVGDKFDYDRYWVLAADGKGDVPARVLPCFPAMLQKSMTRGTVLSHVTCDVLTAHHIHRCFPDHCVDDACPYMFRVLLYSLVVTVVSLAPVPTIICQSELLIQARASARLEEPHERAAQQQKHKP